MTAPRPPQPASAENASPSASRPPSRLAGHRWEMGLVVMLGLLFFRQTKGVVYAYFWGQIFKRKMLAYPSAKTRSKEASQR